MGYEAIAPINFCSSLAISIEILIYLSGLYENDRQIFSDLCIPAQQYQFV